MQNSSPEQARRADDPLPEACTVAPGIWQITLPIPFPLRTVNIYALVAEEGWAMIDAGMGTPDARTAFASGLERIRAHITELRTIVLTHHHPDHIGLSGELQEQSGARVYMHPSDESSVHVIWEGTMSERFARVSNFFRQHGLEHTDLWYTHVDPDAMRMVLRVPPHETFELIEDGALIELAGERYRVIWVPGHSDGQVVLFRERDGVLLAADHVLPRITPNIGLYSANNRPDPLGDYLDSLRKIEDLPASLVLPGHGEPFIDLSGRIHEIVDHHQNRLTQILELLKERPRHAADLTHHIFPGRRIENHEALRMAIAEVLAHLEYLHLRGKLRQQYTSEGIILYEVI